MHKPHEPTSRKDFYQESTNPRNHRSFIIFLTCLAMLGWLLLSISAIDGILGTEYHHLLSIHTTIEKVLAGLVFAAAVLVIGIVCCQALKSQMRRVERVQVVLQLLLAILCMAYVVLAAVFGIIPMVPLGMAIVIAPPAVALTSMLEQQLHNLARGLNMKKRSSSMKGGKFSFKTFKDWLQQGAPESMASMDLDVNEEILEQGLATAPNPWQAEDDELCPEISIPWFQVSPATYERMSDAPEKCPSPCPEDNVPGVTGWNPNTGASHVVDAV